MDLSSYQYSPMAKNSKNVPDILVFFLSRQYLPQLPNFFSHVLYVTSIKVGCTVPLFWQQNSDWRITRSSGEFNLDNTGLNKTSFSRTHLHKTSLCNTISEIKNSGYGTRSGSKGSCNWWSSNWRANSSDCRSCRSSSFVCTTRAGEVRSTWLLWTQGSGSKNW